MGVAKHAREGLGLSGAAGFEVGLAVGADSDRISGVEFSVHVTPAAQKVRATAKGMNFRIVIRPRKPTSAL